MREQMMRDRKEQNKERLRKVTEAQEEETIAKDMLAELDSRIQYYIDLNANLTDEAEIDANWEAVSDLRDERFTLKEDFTMKEAAKIAIKDQYDNEISAQM
jgi:hypothetical protein